MNLKIVLAVKPDVVCVGVKTLLLEVDRTCEIERIASDVDIIQVVYDKKPDIIVLDDAMIVSHWAKIRREFPCLNCRIIWLKGDDALDSFVEDKIDIIRMNESSITLYDEFQVVLSEIKGSIKDEEGELTTRERDILRDIALGLSNKEIAEKNFISTHTVITHRKNITRKLGIKSISGLTIYAIVNKIIAIEDVGNLE